MRFRKNQRRVLDRLKERMKGDPAKCTILCMSEFGLVELTRQRSRESLLQSLFTACPYCSGSAIIKTHDSILIEIERAIKKAVCCFKQTSLKLRIHPDLFQHMQNKNEVSFLTAFLKTLKATIEYETSDILHLNDFQIMSKPNNQILDL